MRPESPLPWSLLLQQKSPLGCGPITGRLHRLPCYLRLYTRRHE